MREARPYVSHLLTPIYLGAVATLMVNDHILKQASPGGITGKLSDFAGLFAFAVFLSVAIRCQVPAIHAAIAVAFVAWKSPLSDPLIAAWNATMPFRIARVIDYWDLLSLSVLPLSVAYLRRQWWAIAPDVARVVAAAMISLVAFTATSRMPKPGELYISVAEGQIHDGQYDKAIGNLDQALKEKPDLAKALYLRGLAKLKLGDETGGRGDIAAAAAIDSKYEQPTAGGTSRAD